MFSRFSRPFGKTRVPPRIFSLVFLRQEKPNNHLWFGLMGLVGLHVHVVARGLKDVYRVDALGSVPIISLVYWEVSA